MRFLLILLVCLIPFAAKAQQAATGFAMPASPNARAVALIQAVAFTRQILLRIDDATRSGNYTVLRDLAAPSLRETQTSADLAATLSPLRARKIDLLSASVLEPVFTQSIIVHDGAEMQLEGYLPTAPMRTNFSFSLNAIAGSWQLASLKIDLVEPPANPPKRSLRANADVKPSLY